MPLPLPSVHLLSRRDKRTQQPVHPPLPLVLHLGLACLAISIACQPHITAGGAAAGAPRDRAIIRRGLLQLAADALLQGGDVAASVEPACVALLPLSKASPGGGAPGRVRQRHPDRPSCGGGRASPSTMQATAPSTPSTCSSCSRSIDARRGRGHRRCWSGSQSSLASGSLEGRTTSMGSLMTSSFPSW